MRFARSGSSVIKVARFEASKHSYLTPSTTYNWSESFPNPAIAPAPEIPPQFGFVDLANINPLLRDLADMPPVVPAVLPPLKVRAKGRPRKADSSTTRQPSAWEQNGGPNSSGVSSTPNRTWN